MNTLYFENDVNETVIKEVVAEVEKNGNCKVCFNVTGRTLHETLSRQLREKLPQYQFDIDYMLYKCEIKKLKV